MVVLARAAGMEHERLLQQQEAEQVAKAAKGILEDPPHRDPHACNVLNAIRGLLYAGVASIAPKDLLAWMLYASRTRPRGWRQGSQQNRTINPSFTTTKGWAYKIGKGLVKTPK